MLTSSSFRLLYICRGFCSDPDTPLTSKPAWLVAAKDAPRFLKTTFLFERDHKQAQSFLASFSKTSNKQNQADQSSTSSPSPTSIEDVDPSITTYSPNSLTITASSRTPRVLVLTDNPMPGWHAISSYIPFSPNPSASSTHSTLTPTSITLPILPANGGLHRSLLLPPGRHIITMTYFPTKFAIGIAISLTAYAIYGLALMYAYFSK